MRLLSRALFTLALLGGLGFGSYAFGKYVLSSRLFGNKSSNLNQNFGESTAAPAARASNSKGAQAATASVELLPADGSAGGTSASNTAKAERPVIIPQATGDRSNTSGDDGSTRGGTGDFIDQPTSSSASNPDSTPPRSRRPRTSSNSSSSSTRSSASSGTPTSTERPRKRRKRRRTRTTPTTPTAQTPVIRDEPARQTYSTEPDVVVSEGSNQGASNDNSPAPRAERIEPRREAAPSNDTPSEPTPRRRRTRVRVEEPAPRERTRIEPRREVAPSRRQESPVPRPEGGGDDGGGESPVPIPE